MLVEPTTTYDPAASRDPVGRMWALDPRTGLRAVAGIAREAVTRCEQVAPTPLNDVYAIGA